MTKKQDEMKGQLARALADYDNLRKRADAEKEAWTKFAAMGTIIKLLPVLDTMEAALKHLQDQGLYLAINDFKKVLTDEGLTEINPKAGEPFDHELEEALELVPGGKKDEVAETVLTGWKYSDGPVLRHAKVKVYAGEVAKK
jgi:molecular chaperone GrpE